MDVEMRQLPLDIKMARAQKQLAEVKLGIARLRQRLLDVAHHRLPEGIDLDLIRARRTESAYTPEGLPASSQEFLHLLREFLRLSGDDAIIDDFVGHENSNKCARREPEQSNPGTFYQRQSEVDPTEPKNARSITPRSVRFRDVLVIAPASQANVTLDLQHGTTVQMSRQECLNLIHTLRSAIGREHPTKKADSAATEPAK